MAPGSLRRLTFKALEDSQPQLQIAAIPFLRLAHLCLWEAGMEAPEKLNLSVV
jgi:hypothetical protein